jgi:predicted MFS family arabinose efflux permease
MITEEASLPVKAKIAYVLPRYIWVILAVVFLAGIAEPMAQFAMPPLLPVLSPLFKLSLSAAGLLMSIFAVIQFVMAIPAGLMITRTGVKVAGLTALAFEVVGTAIEALSPNTEILFLGRIIEGVGMAMIAVAGPTAIALWFGSQKRGFAMGVWATWVPLGGTIMLNSAPLILRIAGWRFVFWALAAFAAIVLCIYAAFYRAPRAEEMPPDSAPPKDDAISVGALLSGLRNINVLKLCLAQICFVFPTLAVGTFAPTFLTKVRGYPLETAAFMTSLMTLVPIFTAFATGMFSDHLGKRKIFLLGGFTLLFLNYFLPFRVIGAPLWIFFILCGVLGATIPPIMWASLPEVSGKTRIPIAMSAVSVTQALGTFLGPAVFGVLADKMGFASAGLILPVFGLIGFILVFTIKLR